MKKKLVSLLLASAMVASLAACGGTSTDETKGGSDNSSKSGTEIRIVNGKKSQKLTKKKLV